ncbi:MAG: hypothetical protein AABY07_04435, partial [Nanoarchaeota archaeon]
MTDDLEKRLRDLEQKVSNSLDNPGTTSSSSHSSTTGSGSSGSHSSGKRGLGWILGGLFAGAFAGGIAYLGHSMVKRPLKTGLAICGTLFGLMIMGDYISSNRSQENQRVVQQYNSPEYNKEMIERYLYEGQINGNSYREGARFAESVGEDREALRMYYYYRSYVRGLGYPLYAGEVDKPIKKLENILKEKNIPLPSKSR